MDWFKVLIPVFLFITLGGCIDQTINSMTISNMLNTQSIPNDYSIVYTTSNGKQVVTTTRIEAAISGGEVIRFDANTQSGGGTATNFETTTCQQKWSSSQDSNNTCSCTIKRQESDGRQEEQRTHACDGLEAAKNIKTIPKITDELKKEIPLWGMHPTENCFASADKKFQICFENSTLSEVTKKTSSMGAISNLTWKLIR